MRQKRIQEINSGFGLIELLIVLGLMSIIVLSTVGLNVQLAKQNKHIADLSALDSFVRSLPTVIGDNLSWAATTQRNANMTCLTRDPATGLGRGSSCVVNQRNVFDLYDASGRLVYNSSDNRNGITQDGLLCGPIVNSPQRPPNVVAANVNATFSANAGSPRCPMQYRLEWVALDNNPHPVVAIIISLNIARAAGNRPVFDLVINPAKYSYSGSSAWTYANPQSVLTLQGNVWPTSFIYRSAM